jgi:hypothetical protein
MVSFDVDDLDLLDGDFELLGLEFSQILLWLMIAHEVHAADGWT